MDKQLLKAYIRTIVEEEVKRVLPELLSEAVQEIKQLSESRTPAAPSAKPAIDRSKLAAMMGMTREGDTFMASTNNLIIPEGAPANSDPEVVKAINKDYSALMKKMGIT
jgi:hypothetical protein